MRTIKMTPKLVNIMEEQLQAFKEKFGREPGPNDPVFFDPDYDVPTPINEDKFASILLKACKEVNFTEDQIKRMFLGLGFDYSKYREVL